MLKKKEEKKSVTKGLMGWGGQPLFLEHQLAPLKTSQEEHEEKKDKGRKCSHFCS